MNGKVLKTIFSFLLLLLVVAGAFASADEIKNRMIARLPVIKDLKAKGIIGEDQAGYLQFRGSHREKQDVVNAENSDRKAVYTNIAQQQGTTAELVGKHRARQIADKADPGEWLQDANGNWHQKK
ncbi:MAG: YdbL family protein [Desulfobacterales bacterium]|nr:MAG: YdbL family protein [Desulfobacterales bacterium]